jgi:hypothetical protein
MNALLAQIDTGTAWQQVDVGNGPTAQLDGGQIATGQLDPGDIARAQVEPWFRLQIDPLIGAFAQLDPGQHQLSQ